MITYEANLNCDGAGCKTSPVTSSLYEKPGTAKYFLFAKAVKIDWVFINDEHYCPNCAELFPNCAELFGPNLITALRESIKKEEARKV